MSTAHRVSPYSKAPRDSPNAFTQRARRHKTTHTHAHTGLFALHCEFTDLTLIAGEEALLAFEGKGFYFLFLQRLLEQTSTPGRFQSKERTGDLHTSERLQRSVLLLPLIAQMFSKFHTGKRTSIHSSSLPPLLLLFFPL